jgi:hypothetical protein
MDEIFANITIQGKTERIAVMAPCADCAGRGRIIRNAGRDWVKCMPCNGSGFCFTKEGRQFAELGKFLNERLPPSPESIRILRAFFDSVVADDRPIDLCPPLNEP